MECYDFGGRVGFWRFLYSPAPAANRSPPPLLYCFFALFFLFNSWDMHAPLQAQGEAEGSQLVHVIAVKRKKSAKRQWMNEWMKGLSYMWALSFHQLKGGFRIITPLIFINSLNKGFVWGNSPYEELWDHLDNREKSYLRSTNGILKLRIATFIPISAGRVFIIRVCKKPV